MQTYRISHNADYVKELNIERIDTFLYRPIFDGCTFFDKLKNNEDLIESLKVIKALSNKEAIARLKPKGSGKNMRPADPSDYSIPFYRE